MRAGNRGREKATGTGDLFEARLSDVAAIVLAAGRGSRFGPASKMLALYDGVPLVRRAAEAALGGGAAPVLVVVGHGADDVAERLAGLAVVIVHNPDFGDGLSTSLRRGFAALPAGAMGAAILLGDMPMVGPALVASLIAAWRASGRPDAFAPTCGGRRGNPVILARRLAPEIAALTGDVGAGALLVGRAVLHETGDPAILADADTPGALARLAAQASTTPCRIAE